MGRFRRRTEQDLDGTFATISDPRSPIFPDAGDFRLPEKRSRHSGEEKRELNRKSRQLGDHN